MTAASANKVTVPGDNRLDELKLGNKTPFWHKIPIIKELRVAVGWQKGMLITGLVLTAFFLLVAIFAPLIAPYSYAQLKGADGVSFPAQAAPSSEHIWGTTAAGFDVFSRVVWGARTAVIAIVDKLIKQRKDSIAAFEAANRSDLADVEKAEMEVLKVYLPERMGEAEITAAVQAIVAELGASGPGDMGKVMGAVKSKLAGKADMGLVSAAVKAALSK